MTTHAPILLSEGTASAIRIWKLIPVASRVEPSRHLYQGKEYTPAATTDIRKTLAQHALFGRPA